MPYHRYREITPLASRVAESNRVLAQYPGRVPCIVEPSCDKDPPMGKRKFIVPTDLSFASLLHVVHRRVRIDAGSALFWFTDTNRLVPMSSTIGALYDEHRDEDGFLYVRYATENAFGFGCLPPPFPRGVSSATSHLPPKKRERVRVPLSEGSRRLRPTTQACNVNDARPVRSQ